MSEIREKIEQQFRMAYQLGACDPSDCPLCDCNMDDVGRQQLAHMAARQADEVMEMFASQLERRGEDPTPTPVPLERPPMTVGEYLDAVGDSDILLSRGE